MRSGAMEQRLNLVMGENRIITRLRWRLSIWIMPKTGLITEAHKSTSDMEAKLRYSEFHREAAVQQRKEAILELRALQARHGLLVRQMSRG